MNPVDDAPRLSWSTPYAAVIGLGAGAAVLLAVALLGDSDAAGRLLMGAAAVAAAFLALVGARARPRLAIDGGALVISSLRGSRRYTREHIDRVRVVPYARLGRRTPMIEIDTVVDGHERLIILGRWDLGADPRDVFDALTVHGFTTGAQA